MTKQLPHFQHHRVEMRRTRRRFSGALMAVFVAISVVTGLQYATSHAATSSTVYGQIYNGTTGAGLANVRLSICYNNQYVVSNSAGNWSYVFPVGSDFCLRYVSGAPSYLSGPVATNNQPDVGREASYEHQVSGFDCYHNTACTASEQTWDKRVDNGLDLEFTGTPPTPTPTPVPPPVHTPTPTAPPVTHTATPRPPSGGGGSGGGSGSSGTTATPPPAPDTTPPAAPANFEALAAGSNALVSLSWSVATDPSGIKSYEVDRSLDQQQWSVLSDSITDSGYEDNTAAFGVHYYYRVKAVDGAGNASAYATADATTSAFTANSSSSTNTSFTSDDNLVSITLPAGATDDDADCSVAMVSGKVKVTDGRHTVAGPYNFICKSATGDVITVFTKPITWAYNLKDKLKGYENPAPVVDNGDDAATSIKDFKYDAKTQLMTFDQSGAGETAVLASAHQGVSLNFVAVVVVVILIIGGLAVVLLRRKQQSNYNDYLRSKYYNL